MYTYIICARTQAHTYTVFFVTVPNGKAYRHLH